MDYNDDAFVENKYIQMKLSKRELELLIEALRMSRSKYEDVVESVNELAQFSEETRKYVGCLEEILLSVQLLEQRITKAHSDFDSDAQYDRRRSYER